MTAAGTQTDLTGSTLEKIYLHTSGFNTSHHRQRAVSSVTCAMLLASTNTCHDCLDLRKAGSENDRGRRVLSTDVAATTLKHPSSRGTLSEQIDRE